MSLTPTVLLCRVVAASFLAVCVSAVAGPINYGDFDDFAGGGAVEYLQVREDANSAGDAPPLFGRPSVDVNDLGFTPSGFGASASNGAIDITDGQLNFEFETLPGAGLSSLLIDEFGDYRFFRGGVGNEVSFSLIAFATVTEVNGVALSPADQFTVSVTNGDVFDALNNPTPLSNVAWSLGTLIEFGPALAAEGFAPGSLVTAGAVVLNNTLIAASEPGALAFIAKKGFSVTPGGDLDPLAIPEPVSAAIAAFGLAAVGFRRR